MCGKWERSHTQVCIIGPILMPMIPEKCLLAATLKGTTTVLESVTCASDVICWRLVKGPNFKQAQNLTTLYGALDSIPYAFGGLYVCTGLSGPVFSFRLGFFKLHLFGCMLFCLVWISSALALIIVVRVRLLERNRIKLDESIGALRPLRATGDELELIPPPHFEDLQGCFVIFLWGVSGNDVEDDSGHND